MPWRPEEGADGPFRLEVSHGTLTRQLPGARVGDRTDRNLGAGGMTEGLNEEPLMAHRALTAGLRGSGRVDDEKDG